MKNICIAIVFVLTVAPHLPAQPAVAAGFVDEVRAHFDQWDADRDGQLTKLEVEAKIADTNITGKQAAALAAIITYQASSAGKKLPLSRDFLIREAKAETARVVNPPFEPRFRDALYRIENVNAALFGSGGPKLDGVRQGHIGDCFFVAIVGAVAQRNPDSVRGWIREQPDKSLAVTYPMGASSTVTPPTDGEIALTAFAGPQGRWINVLEKGFGAVMEAAYPNGDEGDPLEAIAFGGRPTQTMRMMTAREPIIVVIRPPGSNLPAETKLTALASQLKPILLDCHKNKRIACAASPAAGMPPGITPRHAFAVLGFDDAGDAVRLWNPHGNMFEPAGEPSLKAGYKTQHGRFNMPLADFVRVFSYFAYETDQVLNP